MQCPKCKTVSLKPDTLGEDLAVQSCSKCQGHWIQAKEYEAWQDRHPQPLISPEILSQNLEFPGVPSPLDQQAALCPDCNHYLSRAKVKITSPFFVERCAQCYGIWCDGGEWKILEQLGLHRTIETLFSHEWQNQVREQQQAMKEQQELTKKVGQDLATKIFELTDLLKDHPHGDFALAYLMRQMVGTDLK